MERLDEIIARVLPGLRAMVVKDGDGAGDQPAPLKRRTRNRRRRRNRKVEVPAPAAEVARKRPAADDRSHRLPAATTERHVE